MYLYQIDLNGLVTLRLGLGYFTHNSRKITEKNLQERYHYQADNIKHWKIKRGHSIWA